MSPGSRRRYLNMRLFSWHPVLKLLSYKYRATTDALPNQYNSRLRQAEGRNHRNHSQSQFLCAHPSLSAPSYVGDVCRQVARLAGLVAGAVFPASGFVAEKLRSDL